MQSKTGITIQINSLETKLMIREKMSDNYISKLIKQFSVYFSSNIILVLTAMISYPIWTRCFSQSEYGQMSLASTTLAFFVAFSKFGIQHSVVRFYAEFKERKRDLDITFYYTTAFISVLFFSILIAIGYIFVLEIAFGSRLGIEYLKIMRFLALLIIFDAINSICYSFFRAEQRVKLYNMFSIVFRCINISLCLLFVLVFKLGLVGFFIGWTLAEGISAFVLMLKFFRQGVIKLNCISISHLKESLAYGLPLIGFEVSDIFLATGDRYIIQYFLGSAAVGLYSSAYNLTSYLADFFANPFRLTAKPIFVSIWEKDGKERTENFLSTMLKFYCMIAVPIAVAVIFFGRDFLCLFYGSAR